MTASNSADLAGRIDHSLLKPDCTREGVERLCMEARDFGFVAVCVLPRFVAQAARHLAGSEVRVGTVVGFPLGGHAHEAKCFEARLAVAAGAVELDMVLALGALKEGDHRAVVEEIRAVVKEGGSQALVKVILETGLLERQEKIQGARLAQEAGAHFVKTSTGFLGGGATVEDVVLLKEAVGGSMRVKASGGIRTYDQALALVRAGADRLGTSAGPAIMQEALGRGVSR